MNTSHTEIRPTEQPTEQSIEEKDTEAEPSDRPSSPPKTSIPNGSAKKEIVRLNVGGTRYEVSRDTIMRYEGSMLASLVSGNWKEGDGQDEIFIDRDGRRFGYILEYLRSDCVYLPHWSDRYALMEEFDYFGIHADMKKVLMNHDYMCIDKLNKEIAEHQAAIEKKGKEVTAILESYRLAKEFSDCVKAWGLIVMQIPAHPNVDKDLLRDCMLSRGLQVVKYDVKPDGSVIAHLVSLGMTTNA